MLHMDIITVFQKADPLAHLWLAFLYSAANAFRLRDVCSSFSFSFLFFFFSASFGFTSMCYMEGVTPGGLNYHIVRNSPYCTTDQVHHIAS